MRSPSRPTGPLSLPSNLPAILREARALGYLGPGHIDAQIGHAKGFARTVAEPSRAIDLGSGGGLPGLVLALHWPNSEWVLIDSMQRRCAFLTQAVRALGLSERVRVRNERSELAAHDTSLREWANVVTARGFGAPQLTAEAAAAFLLKDGYLVVSEPPVDHKDGERWPAEPLIELGLAPLASWAAPSRYRVLRKVGPTPSAYPRSPKAQQRRPLWGHPGKRTA